MPSPNSDFMLSLGSKSREITFPQSDPLTVTKLHLNFDKTRLQVRIALNITPGKLKYVFNDLQTDKRFYLDIPYDQFAPEELGRHTHLLLKRTRQHQQKTPYRVFLMRYHGDHHAVRELTATVTPLTEAS